MRSIADQRPPVPNRRSPARVRVDGPDHKAVERAVYRDAGDQTTAAEARALLAEAEARRVALEAEHGVPFTFRVHLLETPELDGYTGECWIEYLPDERRVPRAWWPALLPGLFAKDAS